MLASKKSQRQETHSKHREPSEKSCVDAVHCTLLQPEGERQRLQYNINLRKSDSAAPPHTKGSIKSTFHERERSKRQSNTIYCQSFVDLLGRESPRCHGVLKLLRWSAFGGEGRRKGREAESRNLGTDEHHSRMFICTFIKPSNMEKTASPPPSLPV